MTQKNFARRYIEKIFLFGLHIYFTPPILLLKEVFCFLFFLGGGGMYGPAFWYKKKYKREIPYGQVGLERSNMQDSYYLVLQL